MSPPDLYVTFHIEPADRSVGIMSGSFSAWDDAGSSWCDVADVAEPMKFVWYDNETGDACEPPTNRLLVEGALRGFVAAFYEAEESA